MSSVLVCVDLGGSFLRIAAVDSLGNILKVEKEDIRPYKKDESHLEAFIYEAVQRHIAHAQGLVQAVCFSVPWVVSNTQSSSYATNFSSTFSLNAIINKIQNYQLPVFQINDVNAATLGEQWKGSLQAVQNGVYLNIGTGVSLGIVIQGAVYSGAHGLAGEIAFCMSSVQEMRTATVGQACLEKIIGGESLQKHIDTPHQHSDLRAAFETLAMHIINVSYILNPSILVLGGGVIRHHATHVEELAAMLKQKMPRDICPRLVQSRVPHVELVGCARHALRHKTTTNLQE